MIVYLLDSEIFTVNPQSLKFKDYYLYVNDTDLNMVSELDLFAMISLLATKKSDPCVINNSVPLLDFMASIRRS